MKALIASFLIFSFISLLYMIFLENNFLERIGYTTISMILLVYAAVLKSADYEAISRSKWKKKPARKIIPRKLYELLSYVSVEIVSFRHHGRSDSSQKSSQKMSLLRRFTSHHDYIFSTGVSYWK